MENRTDSFAQAASAAPVGMIHGVPVRSAQRWFGRVLPAG